MAIKGDKLIYPSFSMVFMNIFEILNCDRDYFDKEFIKEPSSIIHEGEEIISSKPEMDKQIFSSSSLQESIVDRFDLPSFKMELVLTDEFEKVTISGEVNVELALFFNRTTIITYSFNISDKNKTKYII